MANVRFSDYLETRRFNRKVYTKAMEKLKPIAEQLGMDMKFDMSAKYQTPLLIVEGIVEDNDEVPVFEALEDYFSNISAEVKDGKTYFHFSDEG